MNTPEGVVFYCLPTLVNIHPSLSPVSYWWKTTVTAFSSSSVRGASISLPLWKDGGPSSILLRLPGTSARWERGEGSLSEKCCEEANTTTRNPPQPTSQHLSDDNSLPILWLFFTGKINHQVSRWLMEAMPEIGVGDTRDKFLGRWFWFFPTFSNIEAELCYFIQRLWFLL